MIDDVDVEKANDGFTDGVPYHVMQQTESWRDIHIADDIQGSDISQIVSMLTSYSDILTDVPGSTDATQHITTLSDNNPVVVRQYQIPLHHEDAVKKELTQLLKMGIVAHADYPYSAPILPVLKRDYSLRLCVDYRKLNQVTLATRTDAGTRDYISKSCQRSDF